jgi:hypothetical protein
MVLFILMQQQHPSTHRCKDYIVAIAVMDLLREIHK